MKTETRVIIVHGWEGKPNSNWFPWLTQELKKKHIVVISPQFPPDNRPKLNEWLAVLENAKPDGNTILVGHSLGCITILRYLEKHKTPVLGAVLVAGFARTIDVDELSDFLRTPVDFNAVKSSSKSFVIIGSDNDPYVPIREPELIARGLGVKLRVQKDMRHFDEGAGITELPSVLEAIEKIVGDKK